MAAHSMAALSTISQALFLIWMNILETYDGHNISHVMKGDEYYPFIHEFRHFFTFQVCHLTAFSLSRTRTRLFFWSPKKKILSVQCTQSVWIFYTLVNTLQMWSQLAPWSTTSRICVHTYFSMNSGESGGRFGISLGCSQIRAKPFWLAFIF